MSLYKNQKCPVCNKAFEDGEDIVVCPECGTPHHRACYRSLGHCANADRHGGDFVYEAPAVKEEAKTEDKPFFPKPFEVPNVNTVACENCGREVEKGSAYCTYCGQKIEQPSFLSAYSAVNSRAVQEDSGIEGYTTSELTSAIVVNANKFLPKFRRNKRVSWNWSAFIFGPYYFFYRKMLKYGAVVTAVNLIVEFLLNGIFSKQIAAYNALIMSEQYRELLTNAMSNSQLAQQLSAEPAAEAMIPVTLVFLLCSLALRVGFAMFADSLYRKHVLRTIDKVNKQFEQDAEEDGMDERISMLPPFRPLQNNGAQLSKEQLKLLMLNQRGGTSLFLPLALFFALQFIMSGIVGF